jgi:hypothetical protein
MLRSSNTTRDSLATGGSGRSLSAEMVDKHSKAPDRAEVAKARASAAAEQSRRTRN